MHNCKNYRIDGGNTTVIGGKVVFEEGAKIEGAIAPAVNLPSGTATIAQVVTALKNAGLMVGDAFALTYDAVTQDEGHADRIYNTSQISGVVIDNDAKTITISLSKKVSALKDFDGGNGWGVHKWLGIGIVSGINYPTAVLKYNGSELTAEDAAEAAACGLEGTGVFVRWVAADLVLAGIEGEKSKSVFSLWADGYAKTNYKLVIVEPE